MSFVVHPRKLMVEASCDFAGSLSRSSSSAALRRACSTQDPTRMPIFCADFSFVLAEPEQIGRFGHEGFFSVVIRKLLLTSTPMSVLGPTLEKGWKVAAEAIESASEYRTTDRIGAQLSTAPRVQMELQQRDVL